MSCNDYDHVLYSHFNLIPETTTALRNQIDTEIAELKSRLQYLSSARNSLAPVHSLPCEILTKIFALSRVDENGQILGKSSLPTSWVSRRWRDVALGDPKLWDRIDYTNRRWASLCLLRSKNVPLFVSISHQPFSKETIDNLFDQLHRIKHLEFGTWDRNPDISGVDLSSAEISESQILPSTGNGISILQTLQIQAISLPHSSLAAYSMPHLAHLKLRVGIVFEWQDLLVPSLRTIHIADPDFKKDVSDVLRVLSTMPLLEEVALTRVLSGSGDPATRAGAGLPLVHLPNITSFNVLETNIDSMTALLNGVVIPAHASISITFDMYYHEADLAHPAMFVTLFQPLFQFVKNRFKFSGTSESLNAIGISNKIAYELVFGFGHQDPEHSIRDLVVIKAIGRFARGLPLNFVVQCILGLPLHEVQRLEFTGGWNVASDVGYNRFQDLLSRMPIVEELIFQDRIGTEFVRRLAVSPTASLPPGLRSVTFSQICSGLMVTPLRNPDIESLASRKRDNNWIDARMILVESRPRNETLKWLDDLFDEVYYDRRLDLVFFSDGGH